MCSLLAARNRPREGRGFWWAFSLGGQPGSSECQPQVNKCVIDVGTAPVSPREAPSAIFFSLQMGIVACVWGGAALCPRSLPSLITEDNTKSRMKRTKKRQTISQKEDTLQFRLFSPASYVSFSPHWCNCSPHTSGSWHLMPRLERVGGWGGGVQEMSPFVSWFAWMLAQNGR